MGLKKCFMVSLISAVLVNSMMSSAVNAVTSVQSNGGSISGVGTIEGYIEQDVMRVVLPTTNLNFLLDPKGIIKTTNGAAYRNSEFDFGEKENGFVFFSRVAGGKTYYSSSTDLSFQNKSSFPVKVNVSASFDANNSGIVLKDSSNVFSGNDAGVCFTMTDGKETKSIGSGSSACFSSSLTGVEGEYQYSYDSKQGYKYEMVSSPDADYPGYNISLNAACDGEASWKDVVSSACKLSVTWFIEKSNASNINSPYVKNLSVSVDSKNLSDVVLGIDYNGHSDVQLISLSYSVNSKVSTVSSSSYTLNGEKLTISASAFKTLKTGTYAYILKFSDGSTDTVKVDIK